MRASASLHVRENNFDFLRFAAALLVLFSHCYPLTGRTGEEPFARFTGYATGGELAVAIFFVMSGYLIASSYQNSDSLIAYTAKRAARILPALQAVVLLTVFLLGPVFTTLAPAEYFSAAGTWAYLLNAAFINRFTLPGVFADLPYRDAVNGSLWTLPFEVLMYIGIVLIGWMHGFNRRFIGLVVLSLAALFFLLPTLLGEKFTASIRLQELYVLAKLGTFFFSGTLIFLLRQQVPWRADLAIVLAIAVCTSAGTDWGIYVIFIALPYLVLYVAQMNLGPLSGFGKYGDFSYGLYIFAFPVQQIVISLSPPGVSIGTVFVASTIPTLLCAILSWHLVESPVLRWNQKRLAQQARYGANPLPSR